MKSFACLLVVLMAVISGPVFSEELVFPAETNSEAAVLSQARDNHTIARPMGSCLPNLLNPLNQKTSNVYFYQVSYSRASFTQEHFFVFFGIFLTANYSENDPLGMLL